MVLIFGVSAVSNLPPLPGRFSDKVAHFLEYAGLGALLVRAVGGRGWRKPSLAVVVAAVALASVYALSDEGHQYFVPNRDSDWHDALADALGASAAAACVYAWGAIAAVLGRRRERAAGR
jgi:VanZ family protein